MSSILLTGGAGFIGSNVANYLYEKYKYPIVILDKLDVCSSLKGINSGITFIKGDICNTDLVNHILQDHKIDIIMNYASNTHVDLSLGNSIEFTKSNVLGTHTLLECSKYYGKLKLFLHVSTDEIFGDSSSVTGLASKEEDKHEPTNPYAATKASAEHLVNSYHISFKLPIIITRSNNVFGPRQFPEKLIPKFITLLSKDQPCCIHGNGLNKRSYLHTEDLCRAFDMILHKGEIGNTYNIGSEFEYTNLEIWKKIIGVFRNEYPQYLSNSDDNKYLNFVRDRLFNDHRYFMNSDKLISMGWEQKCNFDDSLKHVIKWYLENGNNHWKSLGTALEAHQT